MTGTSFDSVLKKIEKGKCRIALNGMIAIQTSSGYKTFHPETGTLTNCNQFVASFGDDSFYAAPARKVKRGDIILLPSGPCCVITAAKNKVTVLNYETGAYMTIAPEHHMFMGNLYFYEKIVSPMKGIFGKGKMNKMLKFMMFSDMMGKPSDTHTDKTETNPLMQMMFLGSMMKDMDGFCDDLFTDLDGSSEEDTSSVTDPDSLLSDFFDEDDNS